MIPNTFLLIEPNQEELQRIQEAFPNYKNLLAQDKDLEIKTAVQYAERKGIVICKQSEKILYIYYLLDFTKSENFARLFLQKELEQMVLSSSKTNRLEIITCDSDSNIQTYQQLIKEYNQKSTVISQWRSDTNKTTDFTYTYNTEILEKENTCYVFTCTLTNKETQKKASPEN